MFSVCTTFSNSPNSPSCLKETPFLQLLKLFECNWYFILQIYPAAKTYKQLHYRERKKKKKKKKLRHTLTHANDNFKQNLRECTEEHLRRYLNAKNQLLCCDRSWMVFSVTVIVNSYSSTFAVTNSCTFYSKLKSF